MHRGRMYVRGELRGRICFLHILEMPILTNHTLCPRKMLSQLDWHFPFSPRSEMGKLGAEPTVPSYYSCRLSLSGFYFLSFSFTLLLFPHTPKSPSYPTPLAEGMPFGGDG